MRFFSTFLALVPAIVSAAPTKWTRQQSKATIAVIKFAQVLEVLETTFYTQALQKFQAQDFVDAGISIPDIAVQTFTNIMLDESTHSDVLLGAIHDNGDREISDCSINFGGALDSVASMVATARVLELVGVGAYLGGAALITDPNFLFAAASILTIEARHQTLLNTFNTATGIPQAFDLGLTPGEVLTIASAFVSGCDIPTELDFQGLGLDVPKPPLQVSNTGVVNIGTKLEFATPAGMDLSSLSCQMLVGGADAALSFPANDCVVPQGINGPVFIFLTTDSQPIKTSVVTRIAAGGANLVVAAGPTIVFIDSVSDTLGALVRNNGAPVDTSNNISPADAQQQLSSATTTGFNYYSSPSEDTATFQQATATFQQASEILSEVAPLNTSVSTPQNVSPNSNSLGSNSDIEVLGVSFVPASTA